MIFYLIFGFIWRRSTMDKQRYLMKIQTLRENLDSIQDYVPKSESDYLRFKLRRLAIERLLQVSIENVLDICFMLIADLHLGLPEDDDHILDLLMPKLPMIEKIKAMKRFRNILVHKYGEINDKMVFINVSENLDDFFDFIDEILKIIK